MLTIVMIIGLFSIAYAETVASISSDKTKAVEVKIAEAVVPAPALVTVPAPPVVPKALPRQGELINWFNGGNQALPAGQEVTIVDVKTGKSFKAMRTYGHNHADMETLTNADTLKMKAIWGGSWSWDRRPVVVICNGKTIAASCAGMPHAGLDAAATESYVKNRSGGFGYGMNLDKLKKNGMDGHFDIHLLGSKTHSSNRVDSLHQAAVHVAAGQ